MKEITILDRRIGLSHPTYFVADLAANHDGDLSRAKDLIYLCAESGADAAKFQHFAARSIVSDYGFKSLGGQKSHQAKWKKSVFQVYEDASLNLDWTPILRETCDQAGIAFFTSPYSLELVDAVDHFVPAYKVGSGDITWLEIIQHMAAKGKPLLIATGASTIHEVKQAVAAAWIYTRDIVVMQCNTNYTGSVDNFKHINLNVLKLYREMYPDLILGLSDHTPGFSTVLGAVSLGARVIEKHFTDESNREGPDHGFSMTPKAWRDMVDNTRELEAALGVATKRVEPNERDTVILQRRAIRVKQSLAAGVTLCQEMLEVLRPCPSDGLPPYRMGDVLGKTLVNSIQEGDYLRWTDLK